MIVKAFRLVWTEGRGQHVGAPRFFERGKAERSRRLLLRDPAVREVRVVAIVLNPILPPPPQPA